MRPRYLILAALWMGVIFYFSSRPGDQVGIPAPWDKLVHAGVYGVLGWLLARGTGNPVWGWGLAVLYGITDELHQSFVPGRQTDALDLLADAVGAYLGSRLTLYQKPRQAG